MKRLLFALLLISLSVIGREAKTPDRTTAMILPGGHNCDDPTYFPLVKEYIRRIGDSLTVDASNLIGGGMMVTYYFIHEGEWEIAVDHTNRIYFSIAKVQFGNILRDEDISSQQDKLVVEYNYLGDDETIVQADVETSIHKEYCSLVDKAYLFLRNR